MQVHDVLRLTTYIHDLYRDRFPTLTESMGRIWYEELKHLDEDLVIQGINRWARHHTHLPPSLDQILEQVEFVRDEQVRLKRQGSSTKTYLEVIHDAAQAYAANPLNPEHAATYVRLIRILTDRSCDRWQDDQGVWHDKLTLEDRATQCYTWACQFELTQPRLAADLQRAGESFARGLARKEPMPYG